jgi:hypothetical protein
MPEKNVGSSEEIRQCLRIRDSKVEREIGQSLFGQLRIISRWRSFHERDCHSSLRGQQLSFGCVASWVKKRLAWREKWCKCPTHGRQWESGYGKKEMRSGL